MATAKNREQPERNSWPLVPQLVEAIKRKQQEAGVTTEDLLEGLDEQRQRLFGEQYGKAKRS